MRSATIAVLASMLTATLAAQPHGSSEAERRLDLRRAQLEEQQAEASLVQQTNLYKAGLLSKAELDRAASARERARLDTQRAQVTLANELPSFQVLSALKSIGADGQVRVDLSLRELDRGYDDSIRRGYLVSLESNHTIVSNPYQQQVNAAGNARALHVRFGLLRDTDEITIVIVSGTRREEIPIFLQRDRNDRHVEIACANFSQEGTLGGRVEYLLQLDRFSRSVENLRLVAEQLPPAFTSEWIDAETNAKISTLRFGEDRNTRKVILRVFVPSQGEEPWLGRDLPLRVRALASDAAGADLGGINLQLRATGAPRLTLATANLLTTLAPGETKRISVTLENSGGAPAQGVVFESDPPLGLDLQLRPASIPLLAARGSQRVTIDITAARDAVPSEYNVKLLARTQNRLATIDSPELSFRVDVENRAIGMATFSVVSVMLVAVIAGIVWTIRSIRR